MATYAVLRELSDEPDELDGRLGFEVEDDEPEFDEVENARRRRMLLGVGDVTVA